MEQTPEKPKTPRTKPTGPKLDQSRPGRIQFKPLTDGLGFHPFSDGLPYAPVSKSTEKSTTTPMMGSGATAAGPAMPARNIPPVVPKKAAATQAPMPTPTASPSTPTTTTPSYARPATQSGLRNPTANAQPNTHRPTPKLKDRSQPLQPVAAEWKAAPPMTRALAYCVDSFIHILFWACVVLAGTEAQIVNLDPMLVEAQALWLGAFLIVSNWIFIWAQEMIFGNSLGKRLLGLKLESSPFGRIGRGLLFPVSASLLGIGLIWAFFDEDSRTLHDRMTGSRVLQESL